MQSRSPSRNLNDIPIVLPRGRFYLSLVKLLHIFCSSSNPDIVLATTIITITTTITVSQLLFILWYKYMVVSLLLRPPPLFISLWLESVHSCLLVGVRTCVRTYTYGQFVAHTLFSPMQINMQYYLMNDKFRNINLYVYMYVLARVRPLCQSVSLANDNNVSFS